MSDILRDDISTFDKAYAHWVAHRHELEPLIRQWYRDAKGREPNEHDVNHGLWRGANEWARWKTWEAALQDTWPKATSGGEAKPVGGIHPSNIGRVIKVASGVLNRGYSYWAQTYVGESGRADAFCGHTDGIARIHSVDLSSPYSGPVAVFDQGHGTTEGWYWSVRGELHRTVGSRLMRGQEVVFDIADARTDCDIWQPHSSEDGKVHSATVRQVVSEGAYPKLGTIVWRDGAWDWFAKVGDLDESHIDASGRWLVIEESDDNRIIDLQTGNERLVEDEAGALSHIDCGNGFMVGEDNHAGACLRIDLTTGQRTPLFDTWNMGHVGVRGSRVVRSDGRRIELLDINGNITRLIDHGMTGDGYDYQVMANLSPCGRVVTFASNKDGSMDLYLWVIG